MRYFKTQKTINNKQNKVSIILITITLIVIFIINLYIKNLSNSTTFLSKIKIEEITKYYLNQTIKKYVNLNTNDYIKIKELIEMPMDNRIEFIEYKYLISSKVINGKVPSIYYDKINSNSSIVNNDVNAQN